jgi:hypothetical protein
MVALPIPLSPSELYDLAKNIISGLYKKYLNKEAKPFLAACDQESFKKVVPYLNRVKTDPEFMKNPNFKKFFEEYDVGVIGDTWGFINSEARKEVERQLYQSKVKQLSISVELIPVEQAISFDDAKKPKKVSSTIYRHITLFSNEFRSLINLSLQVGTYYKQGRISDAENTKRQIFQRYGSRGLKFCNCYLCGYIENLVESLESPSSLDLESQINAFLNRPIFFASNFMPDEKLKEIAKKIVAALERGEEYVAIHGLGNASGLSKQIARGITLQPRVGYKQVVLDKTDLNEDIKEFSELWYTAPGKHIASWIL